MQQNTIHWIFINKNFGLKFSKFPQLWKVWSHYPEDVDRVIRGCVTPLSKCSVNDPLEASGDLGGCLALKGLVDRDRLESKFRPTLEALEPRLKKVLKYYYQSKKILSKH